MGCDIYSIGQYKDKYMRWFTKTINVGGDQRDYNSFAVMADVRNNGNWKPIAEARGFLEDVTISTDGKDMTANYTSTYYLGEHSGSYLTLFEIQKEIKKLSKKKGNVLDELPYLLAVEKELCIIKDLVGVNSKEVRIVFGFDS